MKKEIKFTKEELDLIHSCVFQLITEVKVELFKEKEKEARPTLIALKDRLYKIINKIEEVYSA